MIFVVDNEEGAYVDELRLSGFDVSCETETDAALKFFEANYKQIKLVILDIWMPPGASFEHEKTEKGRRTGIFFYERIRQKSPDLPIIILTVISGDDVTNRFCNERLCWLYQKRDLLPHQLVKEVNRIAPQVRASHGGSYGN